MTSKTVDLDALIDPDLSVTLDGNPVRVAPIDGVGLQLLQGMTEATSVDRLYKIACLCLPSLSEERVRRLTPAQVGAVVKLASEGVEAVEELAPKNSAPAGTKVQGKRQSSPASHQLTR